MHPRRCTHARTIAPQCIGTGGVAHSRWSVFGGTTRTTTVVQHTRGTGRLPVHAGVGAPKKKVGRPPSPPRKRQGSASDTHISAVSGASPALWINQTSARPPSPIADRKDAAAAVAHSPPKMTFLDKQALHRDACLRAHEHWAPKRE